METVHGTTIVAIKHKGKTVIAGDSQATLGSMICKDSVVKVRKIYDDKVIIGFAGKIGEAFVIVRMLENALQRFSGNLQRSAVEVASAWQRDGNMRQLEASVLIADSEHLYNIMGDGVLVEANEGYMSVGSGSQFALGALHALVNNSELSAKEIALEALKTASKYCIYTNDHFVVEEV